PTGCGTTGDCEAVIVISLRVPALGPHRRFGGTPRSGLARVAPAITASVEKEWEIPAPARMLEWRVRTTDRVVGQQPSPPRGSCHSMPPPAVHWYEGMFLRPHHFQAAEQHWLHLTHTAGCWDHHFNWGLHAIEIDPDALANNPRHLGL